MTPLATYGVCILITLALILIPFFIVGEGFALLIIIFPAIIVESITGERGLDFSRKSFVYFILLWLFIFAQVALIAAVFFGFYCFFWGYPTVVSHTPILPETFDSGKHSLLLVINKILLLLLSYFVCRFIYQAIKFRESFKSMSKQFIYLYQILPLKIFPLAFIYLIACLYYLTDFPTKDSIGFIPSLAGYIYAAYLLYAFGRTIYIYARNLRHGFSGFKFKQAIQLFITIAYNTTFLYFFYQLYPAMKL